MKRVVVTSKTKMSSLVCVGALDVDTLESLRLLSETGSNHPQDTPYQIGQVWRIQGHPPTHIRPPHVEDYYVTSQQLLKTIDTHTLQNFVLEKLDVWQGSFQNLFDGCVRVTSNGSGYISERVGIPSRSTWFWLPDVSLRLDGQYYYYSTNEQFLRLKYVGLEPMISEIPQGTLIRVSLARWWNGGDPSFEERCYLQLSGWY